jgi:hypothetical protein
MRSRVRIPRRLAKAQPASFAKPTLNFTVIFQVAKAITDEPFAAAFRARNRVFRGLCGWTPLSK